MRHILFEIPTPWFTIPIMGYGLMIVLGFAVGIALAIWRGRRCGVGADHILNLGLLGMIGGVVGGRLFYVAQNPGAITGRGFLGGLWALVRIDAGGVVYYGGLLLSIGLAVLYIRRKRLSAWRILDIVAPSLMIGLAFGRMGCFLNGCCWGGRCTLESPAAQRALTVTFPCGSFAYQQQARDLPWRIVGADGSFDGDWCDLRLRADVTSGTIHKYHVLPDPRKSIPSPILDVPLVFLQPGLPDNAPIAPQYAADRPWTVRGLDGRATYYVASSTEKRDDDSPWRFEVAEEPAGAIVLDPANVVDLDGPTLNFTQRGRDELTTPRERQIAQIVRSLPVYPVQLYGAFNGLFIAYVLTMFFRRRRREGQVFALMLILKPISRILLEAIRKDTEAAVLGLSVSQAISVLMLLAGVAMWAWLANQPTVADRVTRPQLG